MRVTIFSEVIYHCCLPISTTGGEPSNVPSHCRGLNRDAVVSHYHQCLNAVLSIDTVNPIVIARRCKRSDIVLEDQQLFIGICCAVSPAALLVYDYLITFDREYQLVWKRPFSAATIVFLLARYPLLLVNILDLTTIYPLLSMSCSVLIWLPTALQLLFLLLVAVFSGLRVYALSGRRWKIASLVLVLSLVPVGIEMFLDVRQVVIVAPPPINCTNVSLFSPELAKIFTYVGRATSITVDVLVLAVTVHQTYYWRSRGVAKANLQTPLHTLILRDGTIYFLALLIINIADIVFVYLGDTFDEASYIASFIDPITAIIISRFILNLREVDASQRGTEDASRPSFVSSIQFADFVEPLGAPLEHEFSFSAIDPGSVDEQDAGGEPEREDVLDCDQEIASDHATVLASSEADPGPFGVRG